MFSNEISKSFQGPKVGSRPHAEKGSLCSNDTAAHCWQFRPVTIWAPPIKSWICPWVRTTVRWIQEALNSYITNSENPIRLDTRYPQKFQALCETIANWILDRSFTPMLKKIIQGFLELKIILNE